jgi:hypothetical protein
MKKILLLILLLYKYELHSQNIEDVAIGFQNISSLTFNDNDLNVSDSGDASIIKFSVVEQTPSLDDILNWRHNFIRPIYHPRDIELKNQNLYFTTFSYPQSKI